MAGPGWAGLNGLAGMGWIELLSWDGLDEWLGWAGMRRDEWLDRDASG